MKYLFTLFCLTSLWACQTSVPSTFPDSTVSSFKLGSQSFTWVDSDRRDEYYGGLRTINVKVWYPVDTSVQDHEYSKSPYYFRIDEAWEQVGYWSAEDLEFVNQIPSTVLADAPISEAMDQYPLVLLSPILGGNISQYSYYAESLARSGYIVLGINHLYESEFVILENKQVVPANHTFHDSLKTLNIPDQITADEYRALKGIRHQVLGEDLIFALDQITTDSPFSSNINLDQIGAFGHSIGGAASIYAGLADNRFKAILNFDGTPPSIALEQGIDQAFMFIEDQIDYQNHEGYKKIHTRRQGFCEKSRGPAYRVLLAGTNHNSFQDMNYYMANSDEDRVHASWVLETSETYLLQFFDRYLKGAVISIDSLKSDSLEVFTFREN